ncbi:hypothetical protein LCGC14_1656740 [marine sediment metagenome]|uniref:Uncharacterized protein n=1 Tax=marine sediment metagenome TaxID=412755 RepID=A0A0F9KB20_9ZZZZ
MKKTCDFCSNQVLATRWGRVYTYRSCSNRLHIQQMESAFTNNQVPGTVYDGKAVEDTADE